MKKKQCIACKTVKPINDFYIFQARNQPLPKCKICHNAYSQKWNQNNPDKIKINKRRHITENYEKYRESDRRHCQKWARENPEKKKASNNRWHSCKHYSDPYYRLVQALRHRIRMALNGKGKSKPTMGLLGCSVEVWRLHLENQFVPGMTWENYGPVWHVDHKRPCASFDLADPAQQAICFHYTNTQPLFAADNIRKRDKVL